MANQIPQPDTALHNTSHLMQYHDLIESIVAAMDARDAYTAKHSDRVADMVLVLATALDLSEDETTLLHMAAHLHDIGKIAVPDSVLRKAGPLTNPEWEEMRRHPVTGYEILRKVDDFKEIAVLVRHHHERWDGRGYPDGLRGVNQEKMAKSQQAKYPIIKGYRDQIENKYQWCIAAVPGEKWAKKLFPELRASQAVEKLWDAILKTSRVTDDPIQAWEDHNRDLHDRCEYLNKLHIRELRYKSSNGTDFTVGMIPEAQFCGGGETSLQGIFFNPNIPTEECFISPMRGVAEGIVYATKPLSYQGQLISGFWIRFHEGKAVEWHAEENNELLTKLIEMDEGSRYLGECALVPFDSPINQTGLLFYNTLFDENACCHLALGMGFADTIRDFQNKTLGECRKLGVNDSMIHEDFMIGSEDLSIDAVCEDGKTVAIFRNGTWAF